MLFLFSFFQFRVSTSLVATLGGGLNAKEMAFVAIAWLPKATVQVTSNLNILYVIERVFILPSF